MRGERTEEGRKGMKTLTDDEIVRFFLEKIVELEKRIEKLENCCPAPSFAEAIKRVEEFTKETKEKMKENGEKLRALRALTNVSN